MSGPWLDQTANAPSVAGRRAAGIGAAAVLLSATAGPAHGQLAASLSATSDVRIRGLSLNGGRPALTASLAYDHPSGIYAGAAITAGDTRRFGTRLLGTTASLGYARRLSPGLSWEAGIVDTRVRSNVYQRFSGGYTEAYVGLNAERASVRVFYTPSFFVRGLDTVYVDVNGSLRPLPRLRLFGHAGLLVPLSGPGEAIVPRARYDVRAGVAIERGRGEVQLAWVRSGAGNAYLTPRRQAADALVAAASWSF